MPSIDELKAAAEAFNKGEARREVTPEGDLNNVMRQIQELEQSKAQDAGDSVMLNAEQALPSHSPPPLRDEAAAMPPSSPATPGPAPSLPSLPTLLPTLPTIPKRPPAPDWLHSIVEVVSKEGKHYGVLFKLGDIKAGRAHGYILKENGGREFITVPVEHIEIRAVSKVKAKEYCSRQWLNEHMGNEQ